MKCFNINYVNIIPMNDASFHNQRSEYMDGKANKRVDNLICLLLKYENNAFFNRKTKETMWKYNRKEAREKEKHLLGPQDDFKV